MPDQNLNIGGNPAGAVAACAEAQTAIDSVKGKSVSIDVKVNGDKAAKDAFGDLGKARNEAGGTTHMGVDSRDVARARGDVVGLGNDTARTRGEASKLSEESSRAAKSVSDQTSRYDNLRAATERLGNAHGEAAAAKRTFDEVSRGGGPATEARDVLHRADREVLSASLGLVGAAARDAGPAVSGALGVVGDGVKGAIGPVGSLAQGIMTITQVSGMAALGAGVLTGAVGALGAVGAGTLGGVGAAIGVVGGELTKFTLDSMIGTKKDPGPLAAQFEAVSKAVKGFEQQAVRPYGDALLHIAQAGVKAGPDIVKPLKDAFTEIGRVATGGTPQLIETAKGLAGAFDRLTHEAAPGVQSFLQNMPALANAVVNPIEQMVSTFGQLAAGAAVKGVPAFAQLMNSIGGMGSELERIGAANLTPFEKDLTSMVGHVTGMAHNLAPAVQPAMTAVTDVVNAVADGLGSPAAVAGVTKFANTVSANRGAIKGLTTDVVQGGAALGGAFVEGVSRAEPAVKSLTDRLAKDSPAIRNLIAGGTIIAAKAGEAGLAVLEALNSLVGGDRPAPPAPRKPSTDGFIGPVAPGSPLEKARQAAAFVGPVAPGSPVDFERRKADFIGPVAPGSPFAHPSPGPQVPKPPTPAPPPSLLASMLPPTPDQPGAPVRPAIPFLPTAPVPSAAPQLGLLREGTKAPFEPALQPPPFTQVSQVPVGAPETGGGPAPVVPAIGGMADMLGRTQQSLQQLGPAAQQAFGQVAQSVPPAQSSLQSLVSGSGQVAQSFQQDIPQAAQQGMSGMVAQVQQAPMAGAVQQQTQHMTRALDVAADVGAAGGQDVGKSIAGGIVQGTTTEITVIDTIIRKHVQHIIDVAADALDAKSPSRKFAKLGMSIPQGIGVGVGEAAGAASSAVSGMMSGLVGDAFGSSSVLGVADDRGLQVGFTYGRSIVTGIQSVIKQTDLRGIVTPQAESPQAKAALGKLGLLGQAGSGAQMWKVPMVTLPSAGQSSRSPSKFDITLIIDGSPVRAIAQEVVERNNTVINDLIGQQ